MHSRSVRALYVPDCTTFNARVESLTSEPHRVWKTSATTKPPGRIFYGQLVDGVTVASRGEGVWISVGDCPVIVVADPEKKRFVAAHAGRDSVIDRQRILTGKTDRKHEGITQAAIDALIGTETKRIKKLYAGVFCSVGARHFCHSLDHEVYGRQNAMILMDILHKHGAREPEVLIGSSHSGFINLPILIRSQLLSAGVPAAQILLDGTDTFDDRRSIDRKHLWWSNVRGDKGRNGVLVYFR
ncbi:MAG: laccase domain-containing protein [bacterium]|nr:laccase domain-containing protein [bacterium]